MRVTRPRIRRWLPYIAVAVSVVLIGLGLSAVVRNSPRPLSGSADTAMVFAPVTESAQGATYRAQVSIVTQPPLELTADVSGVVTESQVAVGQTLKNGEQALRVDDRPVFALVAPAPPYRDAKRGDKGLDVNSIQTFLGEKGFYGGGVDGDYGPYTESAVKAFATANGLAMTGRTFKRSWVLWVGPTPLTPVKVDAGVGSRISAGAPLGTGPERVGVLEVTEPSDAKGASGKAELTVGGVRTPYVMGSGQVTDQDATAAIKAAMGEETSATGTITTEAADEVKVVPAGAVFTDADGKTCVFTDAKGAGIAVEPLDSDGATVSLPADFAAKRVLVNPSVTRPDASCP